MTTYPNPKGMKFIEDLRDLYKGEDIWVIGAGESLDDYPRDFFSDKVCIGVNSVFSVFLDVGDGLDKLDYRAFYSVHEHREDADWIAENRPDFLESCFLLLPYERRWTMVWWEDYGLDPYYMQWGIVGGFGVSATVEDFKAMVECMMAKEGRCRYVVDGTTLHWAVEAAVVLGAKKIYVAGGEAVGGYMQKHGSFYAQSYPPSRPGINMAHWRIGTATLARLFKPHGIEIVFYYYGKGEVDPATVTG